MRDTRALLLPEGGFLLLGVQGAGSAWYKLPMKGSSSLMSEPSLPPLGHVVLKPLLDYCSFSLTLSFPIFKKED